MKKLLLVIVGDTNDGDYITSINEITEDTFDKLQPMIEAIKNFKSYNGAKASYKSTGYWIHNHNYPASEYIREDLGEKTIQELYGHIENFKEFDNFTPYGENGIHTIKEISVYEIHNKNQYL